MSRFGTSLVIVPLALCALARHDGAFAQGKTPDEIKQAIQGELALRHPSATAEWWRGLGPQAPSVMISMHDQSKDIYERLRLVEGLGFFDDPTAVEFLKRQASPEAAKESVIRNAAITSVVQSQGGRELEWASGFFDHSDVQTRMTAAEAVQRVALDSRDSRASEARQALEKYLASEPASWVGDRIRRNDKKAADAAAAADGRTPIQRLPKSTPAASPVPKAPPSAAPDARFVGNWQGFLLTPEPASTGLASEPARLTVRVETDSTPRLAFTLEVSPPKKSRRTLKFQSDQRNPSVLSGALGAAGTVTENGNSHGFEATLNEASAGPSATGIGKRTMLIRVPDTGVVIVLRKVP